MLEIVIDIIGCVVVFVLGLLTFRALDDKDDWWR